MIMRIYIFLLIGFMGLMVLPGNALAQSDSSLRGEIEELRNMVMEVQRKNYEKNVSNAAVSQTLNEEGLLSGELEENIRKLSGRIDMLEHGLRQMDEKIDLINKDIDLRFNMMEGKQPAPPSASQTPKTSGAQPIGASSANAPKALTGDSVASADIGPIENETAKGIYQKALDELKAKNYDEAESGFNRVLKEYPNDALAGNAQYWLGEVYYVKKEYEKAAVAFAKGYQGYKSSPKSADSMLKLGMSMSALKKTAEACAAFTNLSKEFPKAEKNLKDRAEAEAKKLKCK